MDTEKKAGADKILNELLVKLFKNIMEIEEKYLITPEFKDISVNDMHIIEAIGLKEPKSMSAIAKLMSITTGTLTKSMDGLSEKKYVIRERGKKDKRVVFAHLTEKGRRAYLHHESFHRNMIARIKDGISEQETTVLIFALAKLNDYFNQIYRQ
ncbi:MAG: MarR family transcriptional regulator [Lachnospiraceae bacterium]|nr:MarR family transcriptional regulator [Lachnospiraceae bacterium]